MTTTIALRPATDYRRDNYGVLLESATAHTVTGRGVHNPSHPHTVEVWENRPSRANGADPEQLVTPHGRPTTDRYTVLMSAQAVVIAATPLPNAYGQGERLEIGQTVELAVNGFAVGEYVITAGQLTDPALVPA